MRFKLSLAMAATVALAVALAGCTGSAGDKSSSGNKNSNAYVTLNAQAPFTKNYNPFSPTSLLGTTSVYETLFFADSKQKSDAPLQPVLATKYTFSNDNKTLKITTRSGVKWNDGTDFSAQDVAFTFNYVDQHAEINSSGFSGSAKATGNNEVTITYDKPSVVKALTQLTTQWIVPEHVWKSISTPQTQTNDKPVGTGPFKPATFSSQTYTLVANKSYWGKGKPQIAGVRVINAEDNAAVSDLVAQQKLSWAGVTPPSKNYFDGNPAVKNFTTITGELSFAACANAAMGCTGPQTDPAVRKAIYYALDRSQLNKLAFSGTAGDISPTYAILPRDKKWIDPSISDPIAKITSGASLGKATQTLEAAGYTKGSDGIYEKGGQRVSLTIESVEGWTDWQDCINTAVQQLKAAGIELKTHFVSSSAWGTDSSQGHFQLLMWNVSPSNVVEPYGTYLNYLASSATAKVGQSAPGSNYARFEDPAVDQALGILANTQDEKVQAQQYGIIQKKLVEDMPYIPVVAYANWVQFDTGHFGNWPTNDNPYAGPFTWQNPDFGWVLKNLTVKK